MLNLHQFMGLENALPSVIEYQSMVDLALKAPHYDLVLLTRSER